MQHALLKLLGQPSVLQLLASVSCWDVPSEAWLREALAQVPAHPLAWHAESGLLWVLPNQRRARSCAPVSWRPRDHKQS